MNPILLLLLLGTDPLSAGIGGAGTPIVRVVEWDLQIQQVLDIDLERSGD